MTKHTNKRTKRRSQKGGILGFGDSAPSEGAEEPGIFSNTISSATDATKNILDSTEGYLQGAKDKTGSLFGDIKNKSSSMFSGWFSSSDNTTTGSAAIGGKRKRNVRSMKGGKGGLGLTYYASPVSGLRVAEPTSWQFYANGTNQYSVKGGSRKRRGRKSRRTRRNKRR